jgi:hypothetical protein
VRTRRERKKERKRVGRKEKTNGSSRHGYVQKKKRGGITQKETKKGKEKNKSRQKRDSTTLIFS